MSIYIGADISKGSIDLATSEPLAIPKSIANAEKGFTKLILALSKLGVDVHVVCESTGAYHRAFTVAAFRLFHQTWRYYP